MERTDEPGRRGGPSGAGIDRWVLIYGRWDAGGGGAKSHSLPSDRGGGRGDSKSPTLPKWYQRSTFGVLELACWFCLDLFSTHTFVKTDGHPHGQGMHAHHTHTHKTAAGVLSNRPVSDQSVWDFLGGWGDVVVSVSTAHTAISVVALHRLLFIFFIKKPSS